MKNSKAFTLIEVLVVVVIIGILAGMSAPRYLKLVENGRAMEAKEVLLKSYGGYQRLLFDGESCPGSNQPCWTRMGMSDPNADSRRKFDYSPVNNWNVINAFRAERIGDNTRWLQIDASTGTLTTSNQY